MQMFCLISRQIAPFVKRFLEFKQYSFYNINVLDRNINDNPDEDQSYRRSEQKISYQKPEDFSI